ncbi:arginine decarboxylase [Persicobacter psychrovividus]|uniref:Arginine decarboxylase n=1 Tax=Persicobacter psychrovividus TaxID=387638 RepID=A0ABN6LF52_9BACT|nr:arginine decarboxylase [Persicobacter psychrovividus]
MKNKYIDLVDQTFDFPNEAFDVNEQGELSFEGIELSDLIKQYGTPLRFSYLPNISRNIKRAKKWFNVAMAKVDYQASYNYCYCTKSSHFSFIVEEALKNNIHLETSSAFDINIVENLIERGLLSKENYIICNGFKKEQYVENIANLINSGYHNTFPILDNYRELDALTELVDDDKTINLGIRIASEEEPKFEFYTSRLGIGYKNIVPFYKKKIQENPRLKLRMLHFFINTGIRDTGYYWNELRKCLKVYRELKKICPELDCLNIGGGFPVSTSLSFNFDYEYMAEEIIGLIKVMCEEDQIDEPHIFTEFGSFTVGESGGMIYSILNQKKQNDRESWNMIDSSFMTTLPDVWAISRRFIMLPINRWNDPYERVLLGGMTCDSDDYYNSEQHANAIFLPEYNRDEPLYIGFFHTGAYQETIGGFGGLQHCLIPQPKHVIIDRDQDGEITTKLFSKEQSHKAMMKILGY